MKFKCNGIQVEKGRHNILANDNDPSRRYNSNNYLYWDDHMVFILCYSNIIYSLIDLCILNQPCILGLNLTWSSSIIILMLLDSVCNYFLEDFYIYIHKEYLSVLYCDKGNAHLIEWDGKSYCLFIFLVIFVRIGVNFFSSVWKRTTKSSDPVLFLWEFF